MKNFKRVLCVLLTALMIVPMFVVGSFAEDTDRAHANWNMYAGKYSNGTYKIIAPRDKDTKKFVVRTTGFDYAENENGGIDVTIPDYTTFPGICATTVVTSKTTVPLRGLKVNVTLGEDTTFSKDMGGFYPNYSMMWTADPITELADPETGEGVYYATDATANGIREIGSKNLKKGLYILVAGGWEGNNNTKTASSVAVYMYDGEFKTAGGNQSGYRWTFSQNGYDNSNGGYEGDMRNTYGIDRPYERLDCSNGINYRIRSDSTLGYKVSVSGKDYYKGKDVGFFPDNIDCLKDGNVLEIYYCTECGLQSDGTPKKTFNVANGDASIGIEAGKSWSSIPANTVMGCGHAKSSYDKAFKLHMAYIRADIDLSWLNNVEEGYVTVSSTGNTDTTNQKFDYTIDTINGEPAAIFGEAHVWSDWTVTKEANCNPGERSRTCSHCGFVQTEVLPAVSEHQWGDWEESIAADIDHEGQETRTCPLCGSVETRSTPKLPTGFKDVNGDEWFAKAAVWAAANGLMNGTTATTFGPNANMTRAQIALILAKLAVGDNLPAYSGKFTDVKGNHWAAKGIQWAVDAGVTAGTGNGTTFSPDAALTRETLSTFFKAYAEKVAKLELTITEDLSKFTDKDKVSTWASDGVKFAVQNGLVSGYGNATTLAPQAVATRGQVALILKNFVENVLATKTITVDVIDNESKTSTFTITTKADNLADALLEAELIVGHDSEYGLVIDTVNGLTADYENDGAYWAISKDGVYLDTGASSTTIANGEHYELTYTVYVPEP